RLNDNKLGKLGVNKDTGEVRHITKSRNADKENERIIKRDGKNPLVESPYSTQPVLSKDAEPTANGANALSKGNNPNSTQTKPKKNLMEDIKENIEAKEVEKKNKKSVKQRLDEKIQNDKKAREERIKKIKQVIARKQKIDKVTDKKNNKEIAGKIGTYALKNLIKLKERSEDK
ncbi:hypothetical protein CJY94_05590, partial [Campylobacter coli]|nr:hypothetical protein [Campylobacter coli]